MASPASSYYVAIVTSNNYGRYGSGSISNPNGLVGSGTDGSYVNIYGGTPGDGGWIIGNMNAVAGGSVKIWAYSATGYYSNTYAYASYDGTNWFMVGQAITVTGSNVYVFGTITMSFKYIAVSGYDQGNSVNLYIDRLAAD
jgi:hypothetical protein